MALAADLSTLIDALITSVAKIPPNHKVGIISNFDYSHIITYGVLIYM